MWSKSRIVFGQGTSAIARGSARGDRPQATIPKEAAAGHLRDLRRAEPASTSLPGTARRPNGNKEPASHRVALGPCRPPGMSSPLPLYQLGGSLGKISAI